MKVIKWLDEHLEEFILMIMCICMACIMMLNVIMRYVLGDSLTWAEELTCYIFVWSSFMSISYCMRKKLSVQITMVRDALPGKSRYILMIVVDVICLLLYAYMTPSAYTLCTQISRMGATSPALGIPMWIIYISPVLGFILSMIRSAQNIYFDIRDMKAFDAANTAR